MDKTAVAGLMRCSWEAVHRIVGQVVAEGLDDRRLEGLYRLGVDEISYKRGHSYLTVVADHDRGRVIWAAPGKHTTALGAFYEALGPQGRDRIQAVSMDLGSAYRGVTGPWCPRR
jgi:transposase